MVNQVRHTARGRVTRVKTRTPVSPLVGQKRGRNARCQEMLPSVFARVLYTRYCAMQLSTRIFASYQRLAHDLHILASRVHAVHESRVGRVRSPYWNRVAIKRHEFHRKVGAAVAAPRFADGSGFPTAAWSSSPFATVSSVVTSTTQVLRPASGAPNDRSALIASSGCPASATAPLPRGESSHLLLALPTGESSPARASLRPCSA